MPASAVTLVNRAAGIPSCTLGLAKRRFANQIPPVTRIATASHIRTGQRKPESLPEGPAWFEGLSSGLLSIRRCPCGDRNRSDDPALGLRILGVRLTSNRFVD